MNAIEFDRLILHPGSPKTGTSGVQNFLARNREELFEKGYLYPLAGLPAEGGAARGHHEIALRLSSDAPGVEAELNVLIEALRKEIAAAPGHTVILSSEEFFGAIRIEHLKRILRPRHCHVYVCLRPQHEVLNANYYTQVTHNRIKHVPDVYFDYGMNRLRYGANVAAFADFCKDTTMSLRVFEKGSPVRTSPIDDFIGQTGLPLVAADSDKFVEHPTLPAQPTLFLRWLNELEFDRQSFFDVFQSLHSMRPKLPRDLYTMSPARIESVVETFDAENRQIRLLYLDGLDAPLFGPVEIPDAEQWERAVGQDYRQVERRFLKFLCARAAQEV